MIKEESQEEEPIKIKCDIEPDILSLAKDKRFADLGLTQKEARMIIYQCSKYTNMRDLLEDIIQEALLGLCNAFKKTKKVKHRTSFISCVVRNTIHSKVMRPNKKDAIYKSINLTYSIDSLGEGNTKVQPPDLMERRKLEKDYYYEEGVGVYEDE